eukprot:CAMPEP_0172470506 /NCGR_PEP_ID=MMETSP1065-20121228/66507_1 /TAXON_ID=265537 /ORGANISM="Amphiprora paludosa, Strain CCMP125" /LENGTH=256 /DNA_ID=CAMNT_0013228455 /DNA_START=255 /DNA_END=1025 /DNA_ORIENTATION=-
MSSLATTLRALKRYTASAPTPESVSRPLQVLGGKFFSSETAASSEGASKKKSFSWVSRFDDVFDPTAPDPVWGTEPPAVLFDGTKVMECGILEDDLKYRTSHFEKGDVEPFIHLNEHRVAVHVAFDLLPLDEMGREILRQVVGERRYDLRKKELILQCNYFASRIENKRYLVKMLDKLILSCQRITKDLDNVGEETRTEIPHASDTLPTFGGGDKTILTSSHPIRNGLIVNRPPKPAPSTWDQLGLEEYAREYKAK